MKDEERADEIFENECGDTGSNWLERQKLKLWHRYGYLAALQSERERVKVLEETLKKAYRKHHMGDDRVGWNDLSDSLLDALIYIMGHEGYQEWVRGVRGEIEKGE